MSSVEQDWTMFTHEEVTRRHAIAVLARVHGNKKQAARELGITVKTLYIWLHKWGIFENYRKVAPAVAEGNPFDPRRYE